MVLSYTYKGGFIMGSTEKKLKEYIKEKYGSLSAFCKSIGMPWTTLDSILKRGIDNSSIHNILKITSALGISADALANGSIEEKLTKIEIEKLNKDNKIKLTEYYELLLNSQGD